MFTPNELQFIHAMTDEFPVKGPAAEVVATLRLKIRTALTPTAETPAVDVEPAPPVEAVAADVA